MSKTNYQRLKAAQAKVNKALREYTDYQTPTSLKKLQAAKRAERKILNKIQQEGL